MADDLVVSEGNFAGQNGTVNWHVESRMDDGLAIVFNTITLTSAQPLGNLRFVNYLDEDIQSPFGRRDVPHPGWPLLARQ